MNIKTFGVVGAGQMGSGIAQVASTFGYDVIIHDINSDCVKRGIDNIKKVLNKRVDKGKITAEEKEKILGRIKTSTDLKDMKAADFVIEAANEEEEIKSQIFKTLDSICGKNVILATNTSSIPIGKIASQTNRQDKIIGMHFMNPPPVMKLIEVVRCLNTSDETYNITRKLSEKFGKTPVNVGDYPAFILNRILMPMINEGIFCLFTRIGTEKDIDTAMKLGANIPMGPLELADLIGLDTCLAVMRNLYTGFNDPKYRPCPLLKRYVEAGWLGRKAGRGFYKY